MLAAYIYEKTDGDYENHILLFDVDDLDKKTYFTDYFRDKGFRVIYYEDDLHFRIEHDDALYSDCGKYLIIVTKECYIPYDILRRFRSLHISVQDLFPKLNSDVLRNTSCLDYNLLSTAYSCNYYDLRETDKTTEFVRENVYGKENVASYLEDGLGEIKQMAYVAKTYRDWLSIAEKKAKLDLLATKIGSIIKDEEIQSRFANFLFSSYKTLSGELNRNSPVLLSRAMEYIRDDSHKYGKFAIIVMDGMSEFDWQIFARGFWGLTYQKTGVFAMIPTTTSISRQCLLSGKFPGELLSPWNPSKEEAEFRDCVGKMGFTTREVAYNRGYEISFGSSVKCAVFIVNDVDDTLHAQQFGRLGMFRDIETLSDGGRLRSLTENLLAKGFDVYITADHGNTPCIGIGKSPRTGVETATKSRRMMVLKNIADKDLFCQKYGMIELPKVYLAKNYDYLVCKAGESFDIKGQNVMSHGGITIDEVIVPFVKIKTEDN